jgi:ATP-dependent Lhr-like helicase
MNNGIAELFWRGMITNDVFAEAAAVRRPLPHRRSGAVRADRDREPPAGPFTGGGSCRRPAGRSAKSRDGRDDGRSCARGDSWGDEPQGNEQARAQAALLLERYGVVAREFHRREDLLPWGVIAPELNRMELRGEIRRGFFVEGLSGMQFALPRAVEELRRIRAEGNRREVVLLNACDPANPCGPGLDAAPAGKGGNPVRISRTPSTYIAFEGGNPFLLFEFSGARIRSLGEPSPASLRKGLELFVALLRLPGPLRPFREIVVEYCDDVRPSESPLGAQLSGLGFVRDSNQTMRRDEYS